MKLHEAVHHFVDIATSDPSAGGWFQRLHAAAHAMRRSFPTVSKLAPTLAAAGLDHRSGDYGYRQAFDDADWAWRCLVELMTRGPRQIAEHDRWPLWQFESYGGSWTLGRETNKLSTGELESSMREILLREVITERAKELPSLFWARAFTHRN